MDIPELRDSLDYLDLEDSKEYRENEECKDRRDLKVTAEDPVLREFRARKENREKYSFRQAKRS
jgi:hypothetical protein